MIYTITPDHKKVKFTQNATNLFPDVDFIYEDDLSLDVSSSYDDLLPSSKGSNLLTLASGSLQFGGKVDVPSGQFALQGFQIWKSTEPLSFSLDLHLYMKTSGVKDVVVPSLRLMKYAVPSKSDKSIIPGIGGLIPPGPTINDILSLANIDSQSQTTIRNILNALGLSSRTDSQGLPVSGLINVEVGSFYSFRNCVITKVVPNFSEAKDEDLAPIACSLAVDFRTVEVVTTEMIDTWIPSIGAIGGLSRSEK